MLYDFSGRRERAKQRARFLGFGPIRVKAGNPEAMVELASSFVLFNFALVLISGNHYHCRNPALFPTLELPEPRAGIPALARRQK